MNPLVLDTNKTTVFLLPIMFPDSTHDEIFSNYFKQAYIGLLDEDSIDHSLVLEFDDDKTSDDVIEDFISNIPARGEVKGKSANLVEYIFTDELDKFQYEHFLKGSYSKFNEATKENILDFWKEEKGSLLHAILYNDSEKVNEFTPHLNKDIIDELKDTNGESWPAPNLFVDEFLLL